MSQREQRQRRLILFGLANIAIVALAVAGVIYWMRASAPPAYDPETLCVYADAAPPHTAIVLDKTDAYSEEQSERIASLIRRTRDRLDVGERLTVFELDARGEFDPRGEVSLCNPGRGDQVNPIIRNPRQIQERYDEKFGGAFDRVMSDLVTPKEAPNSPILEALARLAQTEAFSEEVRDRRIVLVSDMLQNSQAFSAYGGGGALPEKLPTAAETAEGVERRQGEGLRGVTLEVYLIPREGFADLQRGALRDYWDEVFDALDVKVRWRDL